ncbi:nuclear pore complex protein NUP1-like [Durio zibethinus]|uniref:Nuclear pore complex protein NUP1-like n=1 Tax=Durio zibethinus TaxID=66656 RepID=A0A6P5Z5L7_DURZI|nr:nuclear pore complex protein NUP1-like [Durio zibethinus]
MATAREVITPYDGGLGAGGKFRKRPFRRTTQTTPYDRPPTAIRNPSGTGDRIGWFSKLVDPAQRLITSSAHRLFASVFRKRLPPPLPHPPQAPESETNQEARGNPSAATSTDPPVVEGAVMGCENPGNLTDEGGVAELEEILKQKTFTRSEIDRLTSLLRSRTVDIPGGNEEKRSEVNGIERVGLRTLHDKKEEFPKTPVRENGTENHLISTPVVRSTVLDEDVASPAELAKAYMGNRPSKVSVSMLGLHNQMPRGDSALLSNKIFPPKSPTMSHVPRSSVHVGSLGNGFVTPRLRGRSAIYSMAWTPYSRVNSAAVLKGAGTASDAFGGPSSSSQSAWELNRISGSRQGVLKHRSSVLDNDIGSIGPIRRIRQKSNLLYSKTLSLPSSAGPLYTHVASTSSAGLDAIGENGDNSTPGTSFTPVPSKSSEMASKILQQLDKLISPEEKSPTKLSPSMLRGQALKSLENVDSSKFLEDMNENDKLSASHTALPDIRDCMSHKHDKVKENGSTTLVALPDKSDPAVNGVDTDSLMKDVNEPSVKAADSTVVKSVVQLSQQKRWAFQMSAHEDLDLDDDDYPDGAASATFGEGRERLDNCVMLSKSAAAEAILLEKPSSPSEVKPISSSAFNKKPDLRISAGSAVVENNASITFSVAQVATSSVPAALLVSQSTSTANKDAVSNVPKATSPMFSFGEKVASAKWSDAAASTFGFASTNVGDVSSASGSVAVELATSSDQKLENSSSFATIAPGTTNYLSDKTDQENTLNGIFVRTPETAISSAVSTSTSAGSNFKFGASKNSSTLNNGSLASSPFSFSSPMPSLVPKNGQSSFSSSTNYMSVTTNSDTSAAATTSTTTNVTVSSTSSPSMQAGPSFAAEPVFKFASSVDPSTSVSTLSATSGEATESKTQDTSFRNVAIVPFGSTSAFTSAGSNIFGATSAVTDIVSSTSGCSTAVVTSSGNSSFIGTSSTVTNSESGFFSSTFSTVTSTGNGIFVGTSPTAGGSSSVFGGASLSIPSTGSSIFSTTSSVTSAGSNIFGFSAPAASTSTALTQGLNLFNAVNTQLSAAGTGIGTSTQSMPIQFSSSASSPSFGLAGNTTFSSGGSVFASSASVAKPFGSGATFGMSSSSSETNTLSSSSGIASGIFGSNWQAPKTPIFGSSLSGFSFGSSASITSPSSAPTMFGSSTGASSSSLFSFTSAAAATQSQPVFGNTSPGLVFGSTPSSNNDQMEDSMAEDTVQASPPTVPTFGQQPISPPASGFIFGASNPSGTSSLQFGGQPSIATQQNPSPFQASGSLEFGAGGSFSLGSGGGDKSARKYVKVRRQRKK